MIPEIGLFSLVLALCLCLFQLAAGMAGARAPASAPVVRRLSMLIFLCVSVSFFALMLSYLRSDFSVAVVAANSTSAELLLYKLAATWGNHEGSMLLWLLVLTGFGYQMSNTKCQNDSVRHSIFDNRAALVQTALAAGVILYILLTSNPFARIFPPPLSGDELNPLLQDIGLALHPPMLYLGYVGFSMVYSLAIAGLLDGTLDAAWAKRMHPWILAAWTFLTLGIGLGSWWAYRELGWGGFWFWDPVENISLMPWLAGTALLHMNIVLMKRGQFGRWVALLAIVTFSLSLMGTFLVRSGLLTSVHSFASDPMRGLFILGYITLATGGALVLYAVRATAGKNITQPIALFSREGFMVLNNLLLLAACATVTLATLYPMLMESLQLNSVSVGPPYYNVTVLPLLALTLFFAGIGPLLPWGKRTIPNLRWLLIAAALAGVTVYLLAWKAAIFSACAFALAAWTMTGGVMAWWKMAKGDVRRAPLRVHGMLLSHFGAAVVAAAIAGASLWTMQQDTLLSSDSRFSLGNYQFTVTGRDKRAKSDFTADNIHITAQRGDETFALTPSIRYYPVRDTYTTEAAIRSTLFYDIYIALGRSPDGRILSARAYLRPLIMWLWAGVAFMALGGMLAWMDRLKKQPA